MVRGEATCGAPVSVPGKPVPNGSRVPSFWSTCVRDGCTLLITLFFKYILHVLIGRQIFIQVSLIIMFLFLFYLELCNFLKLFCTYFRIL